MIKLFLTDVDGVLTDGTYFHFEEIEGRAKRFHTRDSHGMKLLHEAGIKIAAVSGDTSATVKKQFNRSYPFAILHQGIKNKIDFVRLHYIGNPQLKLYWENIAYIGDDLPDIPLLEEVGLPACPANAEPQVIKIIENHKDGIILTRNGGDACVREFINLVLRG